MAHIFSILPHGERFGSKILTLSLGLTLVCCPHDGVRAEPDSLDVRKSGNKGATNAPITVLFDREKVMLNDSGRIHTRRELLCKALDEKGVDSLSHFAIDFDAGTDTVIIEAMRTRQPDGSWADAKGILPNPVMLPEARKAEAYYHYQQQKLQFSDVRVGTVAFLAYRVEPRPRVGSMKEPHKGGVVLFGDYLPIREKQFVLDCPAKQTVHFDMQNSDLKPTVSEVGGRKIYTWTVHDCPEVVLELNSVDLANLVPRLLWTTFTDWEALGTYAGNLFWARVDSSQAAVDGFLQVTSSDLRGSPALMNATLWTVLNVHYVDLSMDFTGCAPLPADQVWHNHYGTSQDKAVLLAALLRAYGFPTLPVLVPFQNAPFSGLPVIEQFRRVILAVPTGDDTLWVDPSSQYSAPGDLPHACTYGKGCLLVAGAPLMIRVPQKDESSPTRTELRVSVDSTGTISGFAESSPQGDQAAEARRLFDKAGTAERDDYAHRAVRTINPAANVSDFYVSNVADLATPVTVRVRFDCEDFARVIRDSLLITVPSNPFNFAECEFDTASDSRYPKGFPTHGKMITEFGFTYPLGYRLVSSPASVIIENPYVHIELASRILPQGFELTETIETKADVVPTADYPAVRDAFLSLDDHENRKFVAVRAHAVKSGHAVKKARHR